MMIMIKLITHDECLLNARYLVSLTDLIFTVSLSRPPWPGVGLECQTATPAPIVAWDLGSAQTWNSGVRRWLSGRRVLQFLFSKHLTIYPTAGSSIHPSSPSGSGDHQLKGDEPQGPRPGVPSA